MWSIIKLFFGLCAIGFTICGIVVANQTVPNYNQATYFLLLAVINYISAIVINTDK